MYRSFFIKNFDLCRYLVSKYGLPSWCPSCCTRRILADLESARRQQEYEQRRREMAYVR